MNDMTTQHSCFGEVFCGKSSAAAQLDCDACNIEHDCTTSRGLSAAQLTDLCPRCQLLSEKSASPMTTQQIADSYAKATGAVSVTYSEERVQLDGSVTVESVTHSTPRTTSKASVASWVQDSCFGCGQSYSDAAYELMAKIEIVGEDAQLIEALEAATADHDVCFAQHGDHA